jgi:hypothetical protein
LFHTVVQVKKFKKKYSSSNVLFILSIHLPIKIPSTLNNGPKKAQTTGVGG